MATTVHNLIAQALRKIGVLGDGETMEASEARDGLTALRQLVDTWSLEDLMIPFSGTETFPAVPGVSFYRMGPHGDWDTRRPEAIEVIRTRDGEGRMRPVYPIAQQRAALQAADRTGLPTHYLLRLDPTHALIEFDAAPEAGLEFLVTSRKGFDATVLEDFAAAYDPDAIPTQQPAGTFTLQGIQSSIAFPPGYEAALLNNLALDLAPEYGREPPAVVVAQAQRTKSLIKARNSRPAEIMLERLGGPGRSYDIMAGPT